MRYIQVVRVALVSVVVNHGTFAQSIREVPLQFPTIQSAIDASSPGDEVLVHPGRYVENVNFSGKAIRVRSAAGPSATILAKDPQSGYGNMRSSPTVTFDAGETRAAVLDGFTVTGGTGVFYDVFGCNCDGYMLGGGIFIRGASPTILDCVIRDNHCYTYFSRGGGIFVENGSPRIERCRITDNEAGGGYGRGAGIWIQGGSAEVVDCLVARNTCPSYHYGHGGGIWVEGGSPWFERVSVVGNTASKGIGGIHVGSATRLRQVYVGADNDLPLVHGGFSDLGGNHLLGDIDQNGVPDHLDIAAARTPDLDQDGWPDPQDPRAPVVRRVPEQYARIQDALDASASGDFVLVAPGVYFGAIDFHGKRVVVRSTEGPQVTRIEKAESDGEPPMHSAPVVSFRTGERRDSVLEGFTIAGGTGVFTDIFGCNCDGYQLGGGVFVDRSSPLVSNCIITQNRVFTYFPFGGGVFSSDGSPRFQDCRIEGNLAEGAYGRGAGVWLAGGRPELMNCVVRDNRVDSYWYGHGGGVWIEGGMPRLRTVSIADNTASHGIGGLHAGAPIEAFDIYVGSGNADPIVSGSAIDPAFNVLDGDCDGDGVADGMQIASGERSDDDLDGRPDACAAWRFDLDGSAEIDSGDLALVLLVIGDDGYGDGWRSDLNYDGWIDTGDVAHLLLNFGPLP